MRHKIVSVSKAKAKLLQYVRAASEEGQAYLLTKDGEPVVALIPLEDYESFLETGDVIANDSLMKDIRRALNDEKHNKLWLRDRHGKWTMVKKEKKAA